MNYELNQLVSYNGKGSLPLAAGVIGRVKAYSYIGNTQYLKVQFSETDEMQDAYPSEWFDPLDELKVKQLFHFEDYGDGFADQVAKRGEWDVRKELHAALDGIIEEVKKRSKKKQLPAS